MHIRRYIIICSTMVLAALAVTVELRWLREMAAKAAPGVLYVANGANCGAGAPCFQKIQDAVDAANPGDEIRVAAGVYTDTNMRPRLDITTTGVVTQVVYITKTIILRGGYTPSNWEAPDPETNLTILDPQSRGRGIYVSGQISPTIEGLHITGGDPTGLGGEAWMPEDVGGGIYVFGASPTIHNNRIYENKGSRGGGLYVLRSTLNLSSNLILSNTANYGAGLWVIDSTIDLSGNTFSHNYGLTQAGGAFVHQSQGTIQENVISDNQGGGLDVVWSYGVLVKGNTISRNSRVGLASNGSNLTIEYNTIGGNSGDGIYFCCGTNATVSANTILSNTNGSGLNMEQSTATLINNLIADNQTNTSGSGLTIAVSTLNAEQNTIAHNSGGDGSGIYIYGWGSSFSAVWMTNTLIVSHTVGITVTDHGTATLVNTMWGSGKWANGMDWGGAGTIHTGTVNLWADPFFTDFLGRKCHLGPGSAAINQGVETGVVNDIDGEPRFDLPDIGADEYVVQIYLPLIHQFYR